MFTKKGTKKSSSNNSNNTSNNSINDVNIVLINDHIENIKSGIIFLNFVVDQKEIVLANNNVLTEILSFKDKINAKIGLKDKKDKQNNKQFLLECIINKLLFEINLLIEKNKNKNTTETNTNNSDEARLTNFIDVYKKMLLEIVGIRTKKHTTTAKRPPSPNHPQNTKSGYLGSVTAKPLPPAYPSPAYPSTAYPSTAYPLPTYLPYTPPAPPAQPIHTAYPSPRYPSTTYPSAHPAKYHPGAAAAQPQQPQQPQQQQNHSTNTNTRSPLMRAIQNGSSKPNTLTNLSFLYYSNNSCHMDTLITCLFINNPVFYDMFFNNGNTYLVDKSYMSEINPIDYGKDLSSINTIKSTMKQIVDNIFNKQKQYNDVELLRSKIKENLHMFTKYNKLLRQYVYKAFTDFSLKHLSEIDYIFLGLCELFNIPIYSTGFKGEEFDNIPFITNFNTHPNVILPYKLIRNVIIKKFDLTQELKQQNNTYYDWIVSKYTDTVYSNTPHNMLLKECFKFMHNNQITDITDKNTNNIVKYIAQIIKLQKLYDMLIMVQNDYRKIEHTDNKETKSFYSDIDNILRIILEYYTPHILSAQNHTVQLPKNFIEQLQHYSPIPINNSTFITKLTPTIIDRDNNITYELKSIAAGSSGHFVAFINYQNAWYYYNDSSKDHTPIFIQVAPTFKDLQNITATTYQIGHYHKIHSDYLKQASWAFYTIIHSDVAKLRI